MSNHEQATDPVAPEAPAFALDKLAAALAKAQGEFAVPQKTREVKTQTYSYSYAPFDEIIKSVRPALASNGLAFIQDVVGTDNPQVKAVGVRTTLFHSSGQSWTSEPFLLFGGGNPQQVGSALTYARRYSLCATLGITAEDDDDAHGAGNNGEPTYRQETPRPTRTQTAKPATRPRAAAPAQTDNRTEPPHPSEALTNELPTTRTKPAAVAKPAPAPAPPPAEGSISPDQRKRMFAIAHVHGVSDEQIRFFLKEAFGLESSKDIQTRDYDTIITAIQDGSVMEFAGMPPPEPE